MKKLVSLLVLFSFVVGCASSPTKYTYLPEYIKIEDKPVEVEIPLDATHFDPVPIEKGWWEALDKSRRHTVDPGVLYSEKDTILATKDRAEAAKYKSLFLLSEQNRSELYSHSTEAEALYQKRIEELKPSWWQDNKDEVGFVFGIAAAGFLLWAAKKTGVSE